MAYDTFKVLIVDDDPVVPKLYAQILSRQHYEVITASSGEEGLERAFGEEPDVLLLDIMMPKMDGYEVCRRLRAAPRTADLPILILTGLSGVSARQKAREIGADDFVTKGEPAEHLDGRIKMLIKQRILAHSRSWLADLHGNVSVDHALRSRLAASQPFAICFLDLNGMSTYNDLAGYYAGDRVLWTVARILRDHVWTGGEGDHVGYLGNDGFLVLTSPERAERLGQSILDAYALVVSELGDGLTGGAAIPGLTIGIVCIDSGILVHPAEVNRMGWELVRGLQSESGSRIGLVRASVSETESIRSPESPAAAQLPSARNSIGVDNL